MSRRLIEITDLGRDGVEEILAHARAFEDVLARDLKKVPSLRGRSVINVFFESSTRTSTSFELAGKRMSADVVNVKASGSSVEKGESLKDTILTLAAYSPDILVIRHASVGACQIAGRFTDAAVVNAGDGKHAHPTQSLLDIHALRARIGALEGRHVAFVGDVAHSRVARSGAIAFSLCGAKVSLIGPPTLMPPGIGQALGADVSYDIADLAAADVVYVLRMQRERMGAGGHVPSLREYAALYGVNHQRLRPGQVVMHAGPMNRGVEISDALADDPEALVQLQARSGMAVRMAVLYSMVSGAQAPDESASAPTTAGAS